MVLKNSIVRISAIICTYNRATRLERAVKSLIYQTLNKSSYEILVVANGCKDDTVSIIEQLKNSNPECSLSLVHEEECGAGKARNKGVKCARGSFIAFMDDDAEAQSDWLETGLRCFDEVKPMPLGVGGPIYPLYTSPKPAWFKDEYEVRSWGVGSRFLNRGEIFSGSNMIFKKQVFEEYGFFDTAIEIKGESLILGEECGFQEKIWESMGTECVLYYSPKLVVLHEVSGYKMTLVYRLKRGLAMGQSWGLKHANKSLGWRMRFVVKPFVSTISLCIPRMFLRRVSEGRLENLLVESLVPLFISGGRLLGSFNLTIPLRQRPR
jgi:glucosyl-dolichyl phosphate glucuronosyltransferase